MVERRQSGQSKTSTRFLSLTCLRCQVEQVAAVCHNTIVIVHSVGPVYMPWSTHPNVTAIIYAGAPGEQTGPSIVDVMFGKYNPSGRLPFSIADVSTCILHLSNQNDFLARMKPLMQLPLFTTALGFQRCHSFYSFFLTKIHKHLTDSIQREASS